MKLHQNSSNHLKMVASRGENPNKHTSSASGSFEREFSDLFRTKYGYNKYVPVNRVYNDLVHDRHHTHLSSTRWKSVTGFAMFLQFSSEDGPNRLGLEWKLEKETREYQKEHGGGVG